MLIRAFHDEKAMTLIEFLRGIQELDNPELAEAVLPHNRKGRACGAKTNRILLIPRQTKVGFCSQF
jgi:hypothetical protein